MRTLAGESCDATLLLPVYIVRFTSKRAMSFELAGHKRALFEIHRTAAGKEVKTVYFPVVVTTFQFTINISSLALTVIVIL